MPSKHLLRLLLIVAELGFKLMAESKACTLNHSSTLLGDKRFLANLLNRGAVLPLGLPSFSCSQFERSR